MASSSVLRSKKGTPATICIQNKVAGTHISTPFTTPDKTRRHIGVCDADEVEDDDSPPLSFAAGCCATLTKHRTEEGDLPVQDGSCSGLLIAKSTDPETRQ
mmetsp:Transcript_117573/g.186079  ORF Transcript_117573/g.186079 Transcript_117573/m.186079 type:complete len:101 (-) Transcript_117573:157-459(-)